MYIWQEGVGVIRGAPLLVLLPSCWWAKSPQELSSHGSPWEVMAPHLTFLTPEQFSLGKEEISHWAGLWQVWVRWKLVGGREGGRGFLGPWLGAHGRPRGSLDQHWEWRVPAQLVFVRSGHFTGEKQRLNMKRMTSKIRVILKAFRILMNYFKALVQGDSKM